MEYTQWVSVSLSLDKPVSLNPCCNGIYSMSNEEASFAVNHMS